MRTDGRGNPATTGSYLSAPTALALSVVSASVTLSPLAHYRLWSSVDAFFQWGAAGVTATTSSHPLTAKLDTLHVTDQTNTTIAGIVSSGTGTLFISQLDTSIL